MLVSGRVNGEIYTSEPTIESSGNMFDMLVFHSFPGSRSISKPYSEDDLNPL